MKALTLHQPWASLIDLGVKTVETRSWQPPRYMLGTRFAIHAGKELDLKAYRDFWLDLGRPDSPDNLVRGAIICTAVLDGVYQSCGEEDSPKFVRTLETMLGSPKLDTIRVDRFGDFSAHRWLWVLRDVRPTRFSSPHEGIPARVGVGAGECGRAGGDI